MSKALGSNLYSPNLQVATNQILQQKISMQDKIFMIKNFVNQRCVESVKKMTTETAKLNNVEEVESLQRKEYEILLEDILDDLLMSRMEPDHKRSYLIYRYQNKETYLRNELIKKDIEQYKSSENFQDKI